MAKRKYGLLLLILAFVIGILAACGGVDDGDSTDGDSEDDGEAAEDFPNKPIELIISYEAGGGTDVGARVLTPLLEDELGVPVSIVNKPGGGGWIGWTDLAEAKPDGYTIGYLNSPNIITGYLDPKLNRQHNLESFKPIANHVKDPGAIAIRADEDRFTTVEELMEYAQENELTATTTGVGSNDHYAILNMNEKFGTKITPVHTEGGADAATKVLGDHVDVLIAKVGESLQLYQNEEIDILAVMETERSSFLPDVPTLEESGYEGVYSRSSRGLAAPADVDDEKIEILRAAIEKAIEDAEHIEKMEEMGLQVDYLDGEAFLEVMKEDEKTIEELMPLIEE